MHIGMVCRLQHGVVALGTHPWLTENCTCLQISSSLQECVTFADNKPSSRLAWKYLLRPAIKRDLASASSSGPSSCTCIRSSKTCFVQTTYCLLCSCTKHTCAGEAKPQRVCSSESLHDWRRAKQMLTGNKRDIAQTLSK